MLSSVIEAKISMSLDILPANCRFKLEFRDKFWLFPKNAPLEMLPDLFNPFIPNKSLFSGKAENLIGLNCTVSSIIIIPESLIW